MSIDRGVMLDKLQALAARYDELLHAMADPRVLADQERFQRAAREQASLEETVSAFREYQRVSKEADEAASMAREEPDPELREFARAEEARLRVRQQALEAKLRDLLTPKDPLADRNIIMEIRAGAGGGEAGLFAGDLFRMYSRYAERNRWKVEGLQSNPSALGGFKEIIFSIQGRGGYRRLKYESGVHLEQEIHRQQQAIAQQRRLQVGTGERSEKIRTYNFPQSRVTDHRIGLSLHRLDTVLDGDLDELTEALAAAELAALTASAS